MRPRVVALVVQALFLFALSAYAQTASLRVEVRHEGAAVADAGVVVNGTTHRTDDKGVRSSGASAAIASSSTERIWRMCARPTGTR